MKKLSCLLLSILAALLTLGAHAELTPAVLGDPAGERYFPTLIEFPDTQGDANVHIQCVAIVKKSGRLKDTGCYVRNNWEPEFADAVAKAGKKAALVPASDGKNGRQIFLMFRVRFTKKDGEKLIEVLLNPGTAENVDAYGDDHIAAQRAIGDEPWQKTCPKRAKWLVFARAHVDYTGVASSVDLEHGSGIVPTGNCQQAIIYTMTSSEYSPAMANGEAVPSAFIEPFSN